MTNEELIARIIAAYDFGLSDEEFGKIVGGLIDDFRGIKKNHPE